MHPLTLRTFGIAVTLVLVCALSALVGCGGGQSLTVEEIAQHDADTAALVALSTDARKTIQTPDCSAGACR